MLSSLVSPIVVQSTVTGSSHDAELDESAELAHHAEPHFDGGGMPGRLDIDVATVAVGEVHDFVDGVDRAGIDADVCTARLGGGKPLVVEVDADQEARIFHARRRDHAEPERAGAGDHDDVLELDLAALDCVDRAGERLDEGGVLGCDGRRDLVVQRPGREEHVLGHGAKGALAEAVDVVHLAHPVVTTPAIAAVPAGHDLLGDGAVADGEAVFRGRPLPERDHLADEFVTGNHRRLAVAGRGGDRPRRAAPLGSI